MVKQALSCLCVLLPLSAAFADGPAYRVRDIKTEELHRLLPYPAARELAELDGHIYFATSDGVHGEEPWRWSAAGGVESVADLCPGACPSYPWEFTRFDGALYFTAHDEHGRELWRTGPGGTELVVDLAPGTASSSPSFLTPFDGRLFFSAAGDGSSDRELWATDGTAAGTVRVSDIVPGEEGSSPAALVALDGVLYFTAQEPATGRELWRSDGSTAGTERVTDLCPGRGSCFWEEQWFYFGRRTIFPVGGNLLLWASYAQGEHELFLYEPATGEVEAIAATPSGNGATFYPLDDAVLFEAYGAGLDREPWRSDGTVAGTHVLKEVAPGTESSSPDLLGSAGGLAYFIAYLSTGSELWKTDGSEAGTVPVRPLHPSPSDINDMYFLPGIALGDRFVFKVNDGVNGTEPWVTDGTNEGTHLLRDIYPGEVGSLVDWWAPVKMAASGGDVLFFALDPKDGFALWRTDGSTAGTVRVRVLDDQIDGLPEALLHGSILYGGASGGELLFGADDGTSGVELWASDGSEGGTRIVADLEPGMSQFGYPDSSNPVQFASSGRLGFVSGYTGVWSTDGSDPGTERMSDDGSGLPFATRSPSSLPATPESFFIVDQIVYRSDGTSAGTLELLAGGYPGGLLAVNREVFVAKFGELWVIEEDGATPRLVESFSRTSSIELLGAHRGRLLFAAADGRSGLELWRSNGTTEGTELVRDIRQGSEGGAPDLPELDDRAAATSRGLFFVADDGETGRELWVSDATESGTRLVRDIRPGAIGSEPTEIVAAGARVFFFADDGRRGRELWVSTLGQGAHRVLDIRPGPRSSMPVRRVGSRMIAVGDRVYFGATDGVAGVELWTSDGTPGGTYLVQDIHRGPASSSPENFVVAGGCLYFSATDGASGFELWAMPIGPGEGLPGTCIPPSGRDGIRPPDRTP